MKHEKSLINTLFGKVFPMFENAENLTPEETGDLKSIALPAC